MSSFKLQRLPDPPLPRYPALSTTDIDKLRAVVTGNYHPGFCDVPNYHKNFKIKYNHLFLDGFSISSHVNTGHLHLESGPPENAYIIHLLPLAGASRIQYGRESLTVTDGTGCIVSPFRRGVWDYYCGQSQVLVRIERHEMETHLEALTGERLQAPLEFKFEMKVNAPGIAALRRFIQYMVYELDTCQDFVRSPFIQSAFKEMLINGLFVAQPHNYTSALLKTPVVSGPVYVRRVEEYVVEHLTEELSPIKLAKMFGVSLRSLQLGFQKHRGYTLRDFIKKQRLFLARQNLLKPRSRNVAEIAFYCGFNHLGQFSVDYKKEFGESPSETLTRAKKTGK